MIESPKEVRNHYDRVAASREKYLNRSAGFHSEKARFLRSIIPSGSRILEVGCSLGHLLDALHPRDGVGIDFSEATLELARKKYPHLKFLTADACEIPQCQPFDYILIDGLLGELVDIQGFLERLKPLTHAGTRLVILYYSKLWQPVWHLLDAIGWKLPQPSPNWLRTSDIRNFLDLSAYECIVTKRRILFPLGIPLLSGLANRFLVNLPVLGRMGLLGVVVARPQPQPVPPPSVSIVIPCRNERDNIAGALKRTPRFGSHMEFIFCDGNSTDGTLEEIERQAKLHPHLDITWFSQGKTRGKGDAVRQSFAKAKGEVLMILDADLTMPPEELPKFYNCLVNGKGDFINGCRLVYAMEGGAMQLLNFFANWFFGVLFTWLMEQPIRDTLCGTKVLYRKDYEKICFNRSYFGDFDPFGDFDLLFGASKLNLKIVDLPIRYRARTYGTTNISRFRHGLLLFRMSFIAMFKLKFS